MRGGFYSLRRAIEKPDSQRVLKVSNHLGYGRLRDAEFLGRFAHTSHPSNS
jgi:hypothetical protein